MDFISRKICCYIPQNSFFFNMLCQASKEIVSETEIIVSKGLLVEEKENNIEQNEL